MMLDRRRFLEGALAVGEAAMVPAGSAALCCPCPAQDRQMRPVGRE
jgi:hypothetical protein